MILELENRVAPGVLKRSTLERHVYKAGFGKKQMRMYADARNSSSKRFCKPHRMMLLQGDIKYGPKSVFTDKALDEVCHVSTGIPRIINHICEKALMYAFQKQTRLVDDYMVRYVTEHELING